MDGKTRNSYQYSRFCDRYKVWRQRLDVVLRQTYRTGEKAVVNYAGPTFPVVERRTGEVRDAVVFSRLLDELTLARGDGSYPKFVQRLARTWLLMLDDQGLNSLSGQGPHDLLEVLDDRYARRGTLLASQVPVEHWHDVVGDPTFGDAILDRLLNICCGPDYGADGPDRLLGHDKSPYLRTIIFCFSFVGLYGHPSSHKEA